MAHEIPVVVAEVSPRARCPQCPRVSQTHELLTAAEVAEILRADESTVRRWVAQGKLPGARVGQKLLIGRAAVMAFVATATGEARSMEGHAAANFAIGTDRRER